MLKELSHTNRRGFLKRAGAFLSFPNIQMDADRIKDIVEGGGSIGQKLLSTIKGGFDLNEYIAPKELPRVMIENPSSLEQINKELEKEGLPKLLGKDQISVNFWTQELYYFIRKQTEERDGKFLDQLPVSFLKYFDPQDSILDIEDGYIEDMILDLERGESIVGSLKKVVWKSYDFYIPGVNSSSDTQIEVSFDGDGMISLEGVVFQPDGFTDFVIDGDAKKMFSILSKGPFELRNIFLKNGTRIYKDGVSTMRIREGKTSISHEEKIDGKKLVLSKLLSSTSEEVLFHDSQKAINEGIKEVTKILDIQFPKQEISDKYLKKEYVQV